MTQEEKQLLLKDLCGRLPYGVICHTEKGAGYLCSINQTIFGTEYGVNISPVKRDYFNDSEQDEVVIKPFLHPMSSMTEEERKELKNMTCPNGTGYFNEQYLVCPINHFGEQISFDFMSDIIDWLNRHHFDYRGLIEKGLALKAPE